MTEKWNVTGDIAEEIKDSIVGQEPSWKNFLSRVAVKHLDKKDEEQANRNDVHEKGAGNEEKSERGLHLGTDFEHMLSVIAEKSSPPVLESGGALALFGTNEPFNIEDVKRDLPAELDGYIFGVGAGNIYSFAHLFDLEKPPKAIVSVDVMPEVVLAGRVAVQLMKKVGTFDEFLKALQKEDVFLEEMRDVVEKETSPVVKQRLQNVNVRSVLEDLQREAGHIPSSGIIEYGSYERVIVFAAIKERWEILQKLAKEGNIGIGLADITDREVLAGVSNFGDFEDSTNIIYVTNIIDHITDRGYNFGKNDCRLAAMDTLEVLDNGKSVFIDTMQVKKYKLRVSKHAPKYTRDDFGLIKLY